MVVFSCDGCAEVLKKNQVDAHASRCRRCHSVSCADCLVSFPDDEYRAHTSCMTEVERYETKGRVNKHTKITPQQQWMDLLSSSVHSCPLHLKQYFQTMASLDNVPRKEKQFRNFAQNSLHLNARESDKLLTEIWMYLIKVKEQQRDAKQAIQDKEHLLNAKTKETAIQNEDLETFTNSNLSDGDATLGSILPVTDQQHASGILTSETVKKAMKSALKESKDNSLTLKKLRKTLRKKLGLSKTGKGQLKRLIKVNLSAKKFVVEDEIIRLQVA
ncbi:hypothetical protein MPSEU_000427200 [Mayamaea pseudoterrestris]|nr:hypothetical protein MPSEU_000427200 [Mayamaea pseudoterrestris]